MRAMQTLLVDKYVVFFIFEGLKRWLTWIPQLWGHKSRTSLPLYEEYRADFVERR
jgi:hypothetical protein